MHCLVVKDDAIVVAYATSPRETLAMKAIYRLLFGPFVFNISLADVALCCGWALFICSFDMPDWQVIVTTVAAAFVFSRLFPTDRNDG